jgi:diguanylate cyclase (GGDEF)-like protein/PAS domain S-box-containing protein
VFNVKGLAPSSDYDETMRTTRRLFFRVFLPVAAVLVGGALSYGYMEWQSRLTELYSQEYTRAKLGSAALANSIEPVTRDLMYLARHSALRSAVDQPTRQNLAHLEEDFSSFAGAKQLYDQIRWIDETGMEKVRIDLRQGKAEVIAQDKLQNKAQRYYFTDTFKLNPGEVFISPVDLNIEQDKIELPLKPMIRFATPVANQQGTKRGMVILNYYGNVMLQAFAKASSEHGMLINKAGYWLKSPDAADEWGFMLKRPELSMAVRSPEAWQALISADSGQVTLDDGLWTWETVYPLLAGQRSSAGTPEVNGPSVQETAAPPYFWKSVTHQSTETLRGIRQAIALKVAGVCSLLLALIAWGSWKLARAWRLLANSEEKYQTISNFTYDWETWISPTGELLFNSNSCEKITGYSAEAFQKEPNLMVQMTHPEDQALVSHHLKYELSKDEGCEFSFRIILPDGKVRWIEHACLPVFGKDREFLGRRASNRDITERKIAEAQIRQLAYFDPLTGLPNRRMLYDHLQLALAQAKRFGRSLALMFIDLDYFKKINDTLGHEAGDKLLKEVAKRLENCIRSGDTVARVGGDEFIVVLSEIAEPQDAAQVAQKIILTMTDPVRFDEHELNVTVSIGITVYPVHGDDDVQSLMKKADAAMYEAKSAGRNAYAFFAKA